MPSAHSKYTSVLQTGSDFCCRQYFKRKPSSGILNQSCSFWLVNFVQVSCILSTNSRILKIFACSSGKIASMLPTISLHWGAKSIAPRKNGKSGKFPLEGSLLKQSMQKFTKVAFNSSWFLKVHLCQRLVCIMRLKDSIQEESLKQRLSLPFNHLRKSFSSPLLRVNHKLLMVELLASSEDSFEHNIFPISIVYFWSFFGE